jgi:hypothetical protein
MDHRLRTRSAVFAALLLSAALMFVTGPTAASRPVVPRKAAHSNRPAGTYPRRVCAVQWRKGTPFVKKLIRCAARHFRVPGGPPKALLVAFRESKFAPRAFNARSCAQGVYQHLCRYWRGRAAAFGFGRWSPFNARANIFVTMRMVLLEGWAPWGG